MKKSTLIYAFLITEGNLEKPVRAARFLLSEQDSSKTGLGTEVWLNPAPLSSSGTPEKIIRDMIKMVAGSASKTEKDYAALLAKFNLKK